MHGGETRPTIDPIHLARDINSSSCAVPAQFTLRLLGGKWVIPIIEVLSARPRRHGELRRALGPAVHEKVLTETLRRMEDARLVDREVQPGLSPTVLYGLTELGLSLLEPMRHLAVWTITHQHELDIDVWR